MTASVGQNWRDFNPVRKQVRRALEKEQCNIITIHDKQGAGMAHHHHSGPVTAAPSILRLSLRQRVAAVSLLIVLIWAAVYWTIG
jgi:hypothetical protein